MGFESGWMLATDPAMWTTLAVLSVLVLGYTGAPLILWSIVTVFAAYGFGASEVVLGAMIAAFAVFLITPIRANVISRFVKWMFVKLNFLPQISTTEREALDAGVVWSEAELFSGKPNFKKIVDQQMMPKFTKEEQAFMDGPVEKLCEMVDEWQVWKTKQMTEETLKFIKDKGFLGMIIPKEYGGLGFSANLHSSVIQKVATRSVSTTITVMVPNSLGPAELLIHYGTDEQKKKHLPRLARGDDLPCFGLTEPQAGSDAGAITSNGVLFKGNDGRMKIRLNWRKRWITLAAISQTIGLAFRLKDPDHLVGTADDLGITCALVPSNLPGVVLGQRHDPLGVPFYNCPTEGHDVVIDAEEAIIGGMAQAGNGWGMLMECLAAGRGISLPAQSAGGCKLVARVASAHSLIRKQFGMSIGRFEGIEEPLSRIAGSAYWTEAMRLYTISALDQGIKPPVITAMTKYCTTEQFRKSINDGMDILGGAGISMGPRNLLAIPYMGAPISITVEGANIMTRTLIIFGQGALRAHPFAYKEVKAIENNDLPAFDKAFWGHMGHVVCNLIRSVLLSVTRGFIAWTPGKGGTRRYYQKLAWTSASFAIMADLSMAILGGKLKLKEKLTGRFADILSWMYTATCVLHRYHHEGYRKEDRPIVDYCLQLCFYEIQKSFEGVFANFKAPFLSWFFRGPLAWWSGLNRMQDAPSDELAQKVSQLLMQVSEQRDRFTHGIYYPKSPTEALGRLEVAFKTVYEAESVDRRVRRAVWKKQIPKVKGPALYTTALEKGVINAAEFELLKKAEEMRWDAIQVDGFTEEEYAPGNYKTSIKVGPQTLGGASSARHLASSRKDD